VTAHRAVTEVVSLSVFCERVKDMLSRPETCACSCGGGFVVLEALTEGRGPYLLCLRCAAVPLESSEPEPGEP
jgi:hypothetical protein